MKGCLLSIALTLPISLLAQQQIWQGLTLEHEVTPEFGYAFEVEYRTELDRFGQGEYLFLGATNFSLGNGLDLAPAIRYQTGGPEDPSELRLLLDLNYHRELGDSPFSLAARMRVHRDFPMGPNASDPTNDVRPRLALDASLSERLTAFAEYESRFQLDGRRREWTRVRWTGGLEYELTKRIDVELFYRTEERINGTAASNRLERIAGLFFAYTFPDKRDRDWEYRDPFGRDLIN